MTVRLTRTGIRPTVEKPKPRRRRINPGEGQPILHGQPTGLGLPVLGDEQHMGGLNWIFVQDHDVGFTNPINLQTWIPGEKWIRLWTRSSKVLWCGAEEMP
jgi:hypothetical protein